jgi:diguanylate cyclase (GGDEF)-like protein
LLPREATADVNDTAVAAVLPLREFLIGDASAAPHDTAFAIMESTGRVLATYPAQSDWSSSDPTFGEALLALDSGIATRLSASPGRDHLYVTQPLPGTAQPLRLVIRLPADAAENLSRQAVLLVTALALAAFMFWLLGRVAVQRTAAALGRVDWKELGRLHPWQQLRTSLRARTRAIAPLRHRTRTPGETTVLRVAYEDLKRAYADNEQRMQQVMLLDELSRTLQTCQNIGELAQAVARCAAALFPGGSGTLLQRTGPDHIETVHTWGAPAPSEQAITLPLMAHNESLGILNLNVDHYDPWAATSLAERAAAGMAAIKRQEQLRSRAMRDPLTGLYNRRFLEEALTIEQRRAVRRGTSIGVLIMDIDHFKRFNDTYGHDAGDILLRGMGALLRRAVREGDMPCRYGGEEFVVILPGADLAGTRQRAEALREAIAGWNPQRDGQSLGPVTVSIGVAALPLHGKAWPGVLKAADQALYDSKHAGRNRVTTAPLP